MRTGILAKKIGMTSYFSEDGIRSPVTLLFVDKCEVINIKTKEITVLKDYPFDLYWKIILSETSKLQKRVHQLILERKKTKNSNSVKESMKNYPPIR